MKVPQDPQARDEFFMRLAIEEAVKATGRTSPNPLVGCVIVQADEVVGRGYHHKAGAPHAEAEALRDAGERAAGAEVFVTLEPCAHHGRTPPCAEALAAAGVRRVVAGMIDPDRRVQGRGMRILEDAGIETRVGVLVDACRAINEPFITRVQKGRPHVLVKLAGTLDGRIATREGHSQWITSEASRHRVHLVRNDVDAILVGAGTAIADRPSLTTRLEGVADTRSPHRFVVDSRLRTPIDGPLFDVTLAPTSFICTSAASRERIEAFERLGVEVIVCAPDASGRVSIDQILQAIRRHDFNSVLVEGGAELAGAFFDAGIVDRLMLFVGPMVFGGKDAKPLVAGAGAAKVADALRAHELRVEEIAGDLLIHAVFDDAFRA